MTKASYRTVRVVFFHLCKERWKGMCTEHLWKEGNYWEDWSWEVEAGGLGEKGERETFSICSSEFLEFWTTFIFFFLTNILKECEPAAASVPYLEMKLRQRSAGLETENQIPDDITWAPGPCCFQLHSSHVSPQSLLSGLNLSELCWQVSWSLRPSKIIVGAFFPSSFIEV